MAPVRGSECGQGESSERRTNSAHAARRAGMHALAEHPDVEIDRAGAAKRGCEPELFIVSGTGSSTPDGARGCRACGVLLQIVLEVVRAGFSRVSIRPTALGCECRHPQGADRGELRKPNSRRRAAAAVELPSRTTGVKGPSPSLQPVTGGCLSDRRKPYPLRGRHKVGAGNRR